MVDRGVRVRRTRRLVFHRLVDHAAEEESGFRRARPRQDRSGHRRPGLAARDAQGAAAGLQQGHAGGQGGSLRRDRHPVGLRSGHGRHGLHAARPRGRAWPRQRAVGSWRQPTSPTTSPRRGCRSERPTRSSARSCLQCEKDGRTLQDLTLGRTCGRASDRFGADALDAVDIAKVVERRSSEGGTAEPSRCVRQLEQMRDVLAADRRGSSPWGASGREREPASSNVHIRAAGGRLQQIDVLKGVAVLAVVATHTLTAPKLVDSWAVLPHLAGGAAVHRHPRGQLRRCPSTVVPPGGTRLFTRQYLLARTRPYPRPVRARSGDSRGSSAETRPSCCSGSNRGCSSYHIRAAATTTCRWSSSFSCSRRSSMSLYRRWPWLTLVGTVRGGHRLRNRCGGGLPAFQSHPFLYSAAFPRYLAVFGLGFLIVDSRLSWRVRGAVLAVGAARLARLPVRRQRRVRGRRRSCPTGALRTCSPRSIPRPWPRSASASCPVTATVSPLVALAWVGRASYHVFLIQIVYFMLTPQPRTALMIVVNVIVCAFAGLGFYFSRAVGT